MFQTFDHAKIIWPLSNSDESAWAYVELMVNAPWFFADIQITEKDTRVRSSYILSNLTQLNELRTNPNVAVLAVYVVSPPHLNWSEFWKMDQIAQVSIGIMHEDNFEFEIDIYELINGEKYYSRDISKNEIGNIKVIFSV